MALRCMWVVSYVLYCNRMLSLQIRCDCTYLRMHLRLLQCYAASWLLTHSFLRIAVDWALNTCAKHWKGLCAQVRCRWALQRPVTRIKQACTAQQCDVFRGAFIKKSGGRLFQRTVGQGALFVALSTCKRLQTSLGRRWRMQCTHAVHSQRRIACSQPMRASTTPSKQ